MDSTTVGAEAVASNHGVTSTDEKTKPASVTDDLRVLCTTVLQQRLTASASAASSGLPETVTDTAHIHGLATGIEHHIYATANSTPSEYREDVRRCALAVSDPLVTRALVYHLLPLPSFVRYITEDNTRGMLEYLQETQDATLSIHFGHFELPPESSMRVLQFLSAADVCRLASVSTSMKAITHANLTWKELCMRDFVYGDIKSVLRTRMISAQSSGHDGETAQRPSKRARVEPSTATVDTVTAETHDAIVKPLLTASPLPDLKNGMKGKASAAVSPFYRAQNEPWLSCYRRHYDRTIAQLRKDLQPKIECSVCSLAEAIVRYHQESMRTVKYAACQHCGHVHIMEQSTGDLPKMGWII